MFIIGTGGFMSRSYKNCKRYDHGRPKKRTENDYHALRKEERRCLYAETTAIEHGEIMFPFKVWVKHCDLLRGKTSHPYEDMTRYFRREFNDEALFILNGEPYRWSCHHKRFLEDCEAIKQGIPPNRVYPHFYWLDYQEAYQIIKDWDGDWLDVIPVLARRGLIEKAAQKLSKICRTK
jgi:hypothetical protein